METIITLILRSLSLAPNILNVAIKLLENARAITRKWISLLRAEIRVATDADTSRTCSQYMLWAALLCKRTFIIYGESPKAFDSDSLACFIECSIALQDNLVGSPDLLPPLLRNAVIRDLKMVYQLRFVLREALRANQDSLISAIDTVWPDTAGGESRTFSQMQFLPEPDAWWVEAIVNPTAKTMQQNIQFHLLQGHFFVMGQPVGKLPAEYRMSVVLQELFGNHSLLTYPSPLPSITYMLAITPNQHQIHLGAY